MSQLPLVAAITFTMGYFLYYGVILCSGPLFSVNSCAFAAICPDSSASAWGSGPSLEWIPRTFGEHATPNHVLFALSLLPYFFYACMFLLDSIWIRAILHTKEDISAPRNLMHWLLVGPSMVLYSLVQLHGYNVLALKGKVGACIHQLAGKATLGGGAGMNEQQGPGSLNSPAGSTAARLADEAFAQEDAEAAERGQTVQTVA